MFEVGEYVQCENKGVCVVEDITTLNMTGIDKNRVYYILKPVYQAGSTVYVPVDASEKSIRPILDSDEAKKLVDAIPQIPILTIVNDRLSEQTYKDCMRTVDCVEWVKVLKTIHNRIQTREKLGRKVTAVDAKYEHLAEDRLFGELAIALSITKREVQDYIAKNSLLSI